MVSRVLCPQGHENVIPIVMQGVTISGGGAGMNIAVTCGTCGVQFDAAPGDSIEIDTLPDGRLSVRDAVKGVVDARRALADLTPDQLRAARVLLDEVAAGRAQPEAVAEAGAPLRQWIEENPVVAGAVVTALSPVLVAIIHALLALWSNQGQAPSTPVPQPPPNVVIVDHFPTDEEVEQWVRNQVREQQERSHGPRS